MLWKDLKANWKDHEKKFLTKWPKLTKADYTAIAGKREELVARLVKLYKMEKPKAEKEIDEFVAKLAPQKV